MASDNVKKAVLATTVGVGAGITLFTWAPMAIAGSLVPAAMSAFGTIVPGVGTIHAAVAAGGVAATLQQVAAGVYLGAQAIFGAMVGGAVGAAAGARAAGGG